MRIGIDAHILGKGSGGVERFVANLVKLLPEQMPDCEFIVFIGKHAVGKLELPARSNLRCETLLSANPLIERSVLLPWLCRQHRLDALIVQRLAPWACGRTQLLTVVHDITPIKFPAAYRGLSNTLVRCFTGNSVRRSVLVFTPTQTIADEVTQHFALPSGRCRPFYNGVDAAWFHSGPGLVRQDYIFVSGAIEARKNLETLLRARALLGDRLPWQIWIAGGVRDARYRDELLQLASELGIADELRWLGFVSEAELRTLYREARAFVTASRDEGFNIPPLEAMACATPVCCSDIPVHRELFEGAALFFPTESADALAAALLRLQQEPELVASLSSGARQCVARLSWPAMAQRVAAELRTIM